MSPFVLGLLIGASLGPCLIIIAISFYAFAFGEWRKQP
jgi:hypothetical protein